MEQNIQHIFRYWGKADPNYPAEPKWHPLVYHSLDVTAVAAEWWGASAAIQRSFITAFNSKPHCAEQLRAWVLFFIALHDLGKFDLRFQRKADAALLEAWQSIDLSAVAADKAKGFDHGSWGMKWACAEVASWCEASDFDEARDVWRPWLAAVTGHHGDLPTAGDIRCEYAEAHYEKHDQQARAEWVRALETLFLVPVGLSLRDVPLRCETAGQMLLAGFCATCDWIGSNTEVAPYVGHKADRTPDAYFCHQRQTIAHCKTLAAFGLSQATAGYRGVSALLRKNESPRGVQVLIDQLTTEPLLVLIEAPTGSGKTEAALAYAWRLVANGEADSVIFALPTQATANAMLTRAEAFAETAFTGGANIVLAHGKRKFNREFEKLINRARFTNAQDQEEATAQCAGWLAQSRKRVFLGQIGICTVDQVLLSVLPVRHKFVRGFGLNKSVLIVDEVHAYDAYMHGLLGEVLRRQKAAGGSAILLSATLPRSVRTKIFEAWDSRDAQEAPYPALWPVTGGIVQAISVPDDQRPERCEVAHELRKLPGAFPDEPLIQRIIDSAAAGAHVAVVVNLVDDAQRLARLLREKTNLPVDVFHARYRFEDRRKKEAAVVEHYGRDMRRGGGRILVATQVVEQSLDLDFDWLITQICPVDLLFQRIGRLHRHPRSRPPGFELPKCVVLSVEGDDYGLFEIIYGNARVLLRTEQVLSMADTILFPEAYRDWIERVYLEQPWDEEPDVLYGKFCAWKQIQDMKEADALRLTSLTVSQFKDEEGTATSLTRDGEMSLNVVLLQADGRLLDDVSLERLYERERPEALNLNTVPVPASWKKRLASYPIDEEGRIQVMLTPKDGAWISKDGNYRYSNEYGLEKTEQ